VTSLAELRQEDETVRFSRLRQQDARTTVSAAEATELAAALLSRLEGEVRFDDGSRALYATDGSNYRQVPIGVVIPRSIDDVIATVETCRSFDAPLFSRGCGSSLAGK
jgi:FAD/FMN-containing dehydrogenase